jgi:hypothetical protein
MYKNKQKCPSLVIREMQIKYTNTSYVLKWLHQKEKITVGKDMEKRASLP